MYGSMPSTPIASFSQARRDALRCTASCQIVNDRWMASVPSSTCSGHGQRAR
jgi:hypothetical protein